MVLMSREEKRISGLLKKHLQELPFYEDSHEVYAVIDDNGTSIAYRTVECVQLDPKSTRFDIQIQGDTCYLNWINVRPEERRRGYGKSMFQVIKSFCVDYDCRKIVLNPSGEGKEEYWEKLGFSKINGDYIKELNSS